ncbi:Rieske (2Fe-2S) protein [Bradyrhizobium diazoefficiens]|uniref:Bll6426 protein n=2 Tax=Bradyrhizobium diazoefficiens TaxID=1355477 RepID=Q89GB9_BRADU|nr:Rieske (2Fe-2S) protein [Bradyrhizobium diazoefficiens]AND91494.1 (2Fe-2S)-binding protein [Bradyrhizobium diazoefficiens USDA 110]QBP25171.1 Rieske (2Fe-2S) protein [Bradyrhizobium diazoefficiens]WLB36587.1 Rieske (2Fe-2S) protein [Bradyrhizobium diazoefficiens]BAC51691.1 bll6426 [Bradyrhizobium diazoefficiens USDA 110]BCE76612.1 (2Fe-2S)-binding protein [Bradyrhizobium diazoefficiens]
MVTTSEVKIAGFLRIGRADEIGEGQSRGFDPHDCGEDTMFVVRWGGVLQAWRNACPHVDGAPMAWRKDAYLNADGSRIVCHAHGAEFLPDSGMCVQGPCVGKRLTAVPIIIDLRGELLVKEE